MKRINVLDESTSNKIAAGEVVERPYSVVKELIENSIDAEAKNITLEIAEGGQKLIKITDDGMGVHPDDISKAFLPHATSKISDIEDIYKINSMGFRGEALPSIAAVSNTVFKSRTNEFNYGKEIYITGGNINYIKDVGSNVGTTVEVSNLFFNVPARQKFLKSSQRESAMINDIVNRLALAHSDISFKLISNGKNVLTTYASANLKDTIRFVYDKSTYENIIDFELHSDIVSVHGFIGNADLSRGSRNNQSIFVNKRFIKSRLITTAVENAFKSFLTINKFPFFVIFLEIYPELIDINVHPTKSEIKFNDDRVIFKTVFDAVHSALRESRINSFKTSEENFIDVIEKKSQEQIPELIQVPIDLKSESTYYERVEEINNVEYKPSIREINKIGEKQRTPEVTPKPLRKLPVMRIIGQFHNTYILAEAEAELYLIDQHAAHEKILFEKYMEEIKVKEVSSQILITPVVLELNSEDFSVFIENQRIYKSMGFDIEIFGDDTIVIKAVPIILGKPDIKNLFMIMVDNLRNMGSGQTAEIKYDKIASLACKAAVKGNNSLSGIEMAKLIDDLSYINDPFNCPHGRPTIIKMSLNEFEKKFKRIQ